MMKLDREGILTLCQLRDPTGVVSLYVGATPDRQSHTEPEWAIALRNALKAMRAQVKEQGPRERSTALERRLETLDETIEWLSDPKQHGRGRAAFAPVEAEAVYRLDIQMPLPDEAVMQDTAYIRPLVAAFAKGRPSGVAVVDRSGVRLLEWAFGEAMELGRYDFTDRSDEWRELKGPAGANPALDQQTAPQRQLFEERLDEHRVKFLKTVAQELEGRIKESGWDHLVVAGEKMAQPFTDALPTNHGLEIIRTEHEWRQFSAPEIADAVRPLLREAHERREVSLVSSARDSALGGGHGAVGLADTLAALAEGRVQHLIFDDRIDPAGVRDADGRLWADQAHADGDVTDEPMLVERMVERALETSADVTPVGEQAAEILADHDGVAAVLRW